MKLSIKLLSIIWVLLILIWYTHAYDPSTDVSSWSWVNTSIQHKYYRESKWSYDLYMSSGVYLRVLNTWLTTTWFTSGTTARHLQSRYGFDLTINGGYFTYDKVSNSFQPAGRIVDWLRVIKSMVKEFFSNNLDVNLYVTLLYNRLNNSVSISDKDLVVPQKDIYSFYTWPQIIQSWQVMTEINNKLSHRQRKATRTFMIVDMDGNPHLWATIQWYSLPDLAKKIQEMKVFYWQYHVINLDGWSSTSFAAGSRYRSSTKRLPRFFGVK